MGQAAEPLAHDGVDLRRIQGVGDALHARGVGARPDAVVERFVGNAALGELPFEPLVPVQTDLHGIGKVGAELDEQRAEVPVEEVDIVVVDRGRRADNPGIGRPVVGIPSLLGAEDTGLLLSLADEEHAFVAGERGEVLLRDVILPLVLRKRDQIDAGGLGEALHGVHEALGQGGHHRGRRDARPEMLLHEVDDAAARLQRGHIAIEVHPVNRFQFEGHVIVEDFRDTFAYHGAGAPGERGPRGHRPEEGLLLRRRVQSLPAPGAPFLSNEAPPQTVLLRRLFPPHARRSEAEPR